MTQQLPPRSDTPAAVAGVLEPAAFIVAHIVQDLDCVMADLESLHSCLGGPQQGRAERLAAMAAQLRQWRDSELSCAGPCPFAGLGHPGPPGSTESPAAYPAAR